MYSLAEIKGNSTRAFGLSVCFYGPLVLRRLIFAHSRNKSGTKKCSVARNVSARARLQIVADSAHFIPAKTTQLNKILPNVCTATVSGGNFTTHNLTGWQLLIFFAPKCSQSDKIYDDVLLFNATRYTFLTRLLCGWCGLWWAHRADLKFCQDPATKWS